MPCVICHRRIAALPMPVCTECRNRSTRIDHRPPYRPAVRDEQPETD